MRENTSIAASLHLLFPVSDSLVTVVSAAAAAGPHEEEEEERNILTDHTGWIFNWLLALDLTFQNRLVLSVLVKQ